MKRLLFFILVLWAALLFSSPVHAAKYLGFTALTSGASSLGMDFSEALDPDTDWTGQPSSTKILTKDRDTVGWDRGAYAY